MPHEACGAVEPAAALDADVRRGAVFKVDEVRDSGKAARNVYISRGDDIYIGGRAVFNVRNGVCGKRGRIIPGITDKAARSVGFALAFYFDPADGRALDPGSCPQVADEAAYVSYRKRGGRGPGKRRAMLVVFRLNGAALNEGAGVEARYSADGVERHGGEYSVRNGAAFDLASGRAGEAADLLQAAVCVFYRYRAYA